MSLSRNPKLIEIAKLHCRKLRSCQAKAESIFWERIRNRKFLGLKFYRQYPIFHDLTGKESFFIADFYCHTKRLVVEIDGPIHKFQNKKDKERAEIINISDIDIIRFRNDDVHNDMDGVMKKLGNKLNSM